MVNKQAAYLLGILGVAGFLFLVKLMYDMTVQMTRMTEQVTIMTEHVQTLTAYVHGIRTSVDNMSGILQQSSQQIQQLNPMEMMQGIVPGQQRR